MRGGPAWIRCGWLIDGTGRSQQENMLLGLEDGVVASVEKASLEAHTHRDMLDLSRFTLLPGLVDCHVHLFMSGNVDPALREGRRNLSFRDVKAGIEQRLKRTLASGVVAVRDGGDARAHVLRYRRECHDDERLPVKVLAAGKAWHREGRYGKFIGSALRNGENLAAALRRRNRSADHVKIINSGINSLSNFGAETRPQFGEDELRLAAAEAERLGLRTMVHANGREPVRRAAVAGCHSIEHGFFMGRENLKLMAERRTVWVPTATAMQALQQISAAVLDGNPGAQPRSALDAARMKKAADVAARTLDHQLEQLRLARELGVVVALGTDAGSPGVRHGTSAAAEMRLLMTAGFSLAEAVRCATLNGATLLGLKGSGSLARGMAATFVAAPGPPQDLPESLSRITVVFIDGRLRQATNFWRGAAGSC